MGPKQYDPSSSTSEEKTDLLPKICCIKHNVKNNNSSLLLTSLVKQLIMEHSLRFFSILLFCFSCLVRCKYRPRQSAAKAPNKVKCHLSLNTIANCNLCFMQRASSPLIGRETYHYLLIINDRINAFEGDVTKRNLQLQLASAQHVTLVRPLT